MFHSDSVGETILETLFLGSLFYLVDRNARQDTVRQIKEGLDDMELQRLREEVERLKRERA